MLESIPFTKNYCVIEFSTLKFLEAGIRDSDEAYQAPLAPSSPRLTAITEIMVGIPNANTSSRQSRRPSGIFRPKTIRLQALTAVDKMMNHCVRMKLCRKKAKTVQMRSGGLSFAYSM